MRIWLCVLPIFLGTSVASAFTANSVLSSAWKDDFYVSNFSRLAASSANPFRNVELSASQETNGSDEVEVGLKFQLKSYPEWKGREVTNNSAPLMEKFSLSWALRNRYATLVNYKILKEKAILAEQVSTLQSRLAEAQEVALRAGRGAPKSISKSKMDVIKAERQKRLIHQEIEQAEKNIRLWLKTESLKDSLSSVFVEPEKILKTVAEVEDGKVETFTRKLGGEEIVQIQREIEVVDGREKQWIKSLGISHKNKNSEDVYEFQVNIQLPFLFSDEGAIQKRNELVFKRAQKKRDLDEANETLLAIRHRLQNLMTDYKMLKGLNSDQVRNTDPLENLETRIENSQMKMERLDLQREVYSTYLDFLFESELLANDPRRNFIFDEGPIS